MAHTLNLKLKDFENAVKTLEQALNQEGDEFIQDAVIKRFEYSFELCWKTAKIFLSEKFGIDIYSPKECFRELRRNQLMSDQEAESFLKMTNDRNEAAHTYNQDFAKDLYKKVKKDYFGLIKKVLGILKA